MIRFVLVLAGLCAVHIGHARAPVSFEETTAAYEQGQHEEARASFARMARAGMPAAQFNLGAMMLHGEGGPSDPLRAALWIRLAADEGFQAATKAADTAAGALDSAQSAAYEDELPVWREQYSRSALFERHAPVPCSEDCSVEDPEEARARAHGQFLINEHLARLQRRQPTYPDLPARKGIPGVVVMGAWVGPEGRFENPHVIFSDPEGIFSQSALEAFSQWRVDWVEAPPEGEEQYISQTIIFKLDGRSWERKARRQLERLIDQWDEDRYAAYRAAWLADYLGFQDLVQGEDGLVSRIHTAAREGLSRAQIDLHSRLKNGHGVHEDDEAARFWLEQAAYQGSGRAQFLLALRDDCEEPIRNSLLRAAAEQGSVAAIMTVLRNQMNSPETADRALLADLLDRLPKHWYRINPDHSLVEWARQVVSG